LGRSFCEAAGESDACETFLRGVWVLGKGAVQAVWGTDVWVVGVLEGARGELCCACLLIRGKDDECCVLRSDDTPSIWFILQGVEGKK
jgi:hypothetical protein